MRHIVPILVLGLAAHCAHFDSDGSYLGLLLTGGGTPGGGSSASSSATETTSPVKLVQSGTQTMTANSVNAALTTSVDMAASFVLCYGWTDTSNPAHIATCGLTATNQLTFDIPTNNNEQISWYVVEFQSGASVQRGSDSMAAGATTSNITITAVDLAKSFVIVTSRASVTTTTDERRTVMARLTSTTNLELSRNESGDAVTTEWQVVELDGAGVQSGNFSLTGTSGTASVSSLEPSISVVLFSVRAAAASNGIDNEYFTRGTVTDASTLTFTRENATNPVDIAWYAIQVNGASVQKGTASDADANHLILNGTLTTAIDTDYTIPVISSSITGNAAGDLDGGTYSAMFSSTTNLRMTRSGPDGANASVDWFALEFPR